MNLIDILKKKIPNSKIANVKKSFEIIGDIAIIEIPSELLDYQKEIGDALLKLNKNIKVVLKKSGIHKGEFRTQNLEFVCGEKRFETTYKENGIKLIINPKEVYFSSKLSTERKLLMSNLKPNNRILIMFSGCGPYSFVAAKKEPNLSQIVSIELNPKGHELALKNLELNKTLFRKSKLFNETLDFLKKNSIYINEKEILKNLSELKMNFINSDVKNILPKFKLEHYKKTNFKSQNYLLNETNSIKTLSNQNSKELFFYLNDLSPQKKKLLSAIIILFKNKFNFICKIDDFIYNFNSNLKKGYLLNMLFYFNFDINDFSFFDEIFMPLPKDAELFLDCAFKVAKKGTKIHMYDFVCENEFPHKTKKSILDFTKKINKKVKILNVRKVGQYSPRKYRVCCDFIVDE